MLLFLMLLNFLLLKNVKSIDTDPQSNEAPTTEDVFNHTSANGNSQFVVVEWPMGIIRYSLDSNSYDHILAERLRTAMNALESASCVKFQPALVRPKTGFWINITNPGQLRECQHEPSRSADGEITLVLGYDCLKQSDILHALLHALDFKDEITHPHRDQYVRILWDNILPEYRHLFRNRGAKENEPVVGYDSRSIMHFHDRAFTKNGEPTIKSLLPGLEIEPEDTLTWQDQNKLHSMFQHECNRRKLSSLTVTCKNIMHKQEKLKHPEKFEKFESKEKSKEKSAEDEEVDKNKSSEAKKQDNDEVDASAAEREGNNREEKGNIARENSQKVNKYGKKGPQNSEDNGNGNQDIESIPHAKWNGVNSTSEDTQKVSAKYKYENNNVNINDFKAPKTPVDSDDDDARYAKWQGKNQAVKGKNIASENNQKGNNNAENRQKVAKGDVDNNIDVVKKQTRGVPGPEISEILDW